MVHKYPWGPFKNYGSTTQKNIQNLVHVVFECPLLKNSLTHFGKTVVLESFVGLSLEFGNQLFGIHLDESSVPKPYN